MQDEMSRAKQELLRSCPSAAHVILKELEKRVEVVHCEECMHFDGLQEETGVCWKTGLIKRRGGYCDEGVRKECD